MEESRNMPKGGYSWRLRGMILATLAVITAILIAYFYYLYPHYKRNYGFDLHFNGAMFSAGIEQPISFSHRLHVTDKQIDCFYCHPYAERSLNAGMPPVDKCLGCHNYIIPQHDEIMKLKAYKETGVELPWLKVYYNPDHVYFPHFIHLNKGVKCVECHGEVEKADRLRQVTFYMGFCIDCHKKRNASLECVACHQ